MTRIKRMSLLVKDMLGKVLVIFQLILVANTSLGIRAGFLPLSYQGKLKYCLIIF